MQVSEQKIIVCCPQAVTGGPELLHQLVHELRGMGRDARIAYYPFEKSFSCPEPYQGYDAPQGPLIDAPDTFVLLPETATWVIRHLRRARVGVWWLSVDNYFLAHHQSIFKDVYHRFASLVRGYRGRMRGRVPLAGMRNLVHFTQSRYAASFLAGAGLDSAPLTDYLGSDHLARPFVRGARAKEDIIVFNPKKGQKQTRALVEACPDLRFVPMLNMSPQQIAELLGRAKIYIDFGHHPGKDRPPREAAMAGCCVITGRLGSAGYYEDVAIPDRYKLDDRRPGHTDEFRKLVDGIYGDFEQFSMDFDEYRERIMEEPARFRNQVADIFGNG